MAKTLTNQVNLWPASDGGRLFGADAPMHSEIPYDLAQDINNLATYVEPSFQFALTTNQRLGENTWTRGAEGGDGEIFLGEIPIVIAYDAAALCWTLGLVRDPGGEALIHTNIQSVYMFICRQPAQGAVTAGRFINRAALDYVDYRQVVVNETSDDSVRKYKLVVDASPGWRTFRDKLPGAREVGFGDQATYVLVFTATIDSALSTEHVDTRELSLWFEYA